MLLDQLRQLLFCKMLDHLAHILGMLARSHENGIFRLDNDDILYADGGDELRGRINVIAFGVENEVILSIDYVGAFCTSRIRELMLEERRP